MIAQRVREIEGPSGGLFALLRARASIPPRIHRPFHRLLSTRTPEAEWEALGFQLIVPSAAFDPYLIVVILTIYAGCGNINRNDECARGYRGRTLKPTGEQHGEESLDHHRTRAFLLRATISIAGT